MMNKYFVFRKLIDFVADAGNIEITGTDDDGSTITITVELKEGKEDA